MGQINTVYFRDADKDRISQIFKEAFTLSNFAHDQHNQVFASLERLINDPTNHRAHALKRRADQGLVSGNVWASGAYSVSHRTTLILTTDYLLDFMTPMPDVLTQDMETSFVLDWLEAEQRSHLMHLRRILGRDHNWVTKKKLSDRKNDLHLSLPETATHEADSGHLLMMDFDFIDNDIDKPADQVPSIVSNAVRELRDNPEFKGKAICNAFPHTGSIPGHNSGFHLGSVAQDEVLVLSMSGMAIDRAFLLNRSRRTPAESLLDDIKRLPQDTIDDRIYLPSYRLAQEFFASQDIQINL